MILNYESIKPLTEIKQQLDVVLSTTQQSMHALVVGVAYHLQRYTNTAEKAEMSGTNFVKNASTNPEDRQHIPFENLPEGAIVDTDFVKLYGENLVAQLAGFTAVAVDEYFQIEDLSSPQNITLTGAELTNANGSLSAKFGGRDVQVGDVIRVTYDGVTVTRTILDVANKMVAATIGTNAGKSDGLPAASINNPKDHAPSVGDQTVATISSPIGFAVVDGELGVFDGLTQGASFRDSNGIFYGSIFDLTVLETTGSTTEFKTSVRVTSTDGLFSGTFDLTYDESDSHDSGNQSALGGMAIEITGGASLTAGQNFRFSVKGAYENIDLGTDLEIAGTYIGTKDTTYLITVIENTGGAVTGAKVLVQDTKGVDTGGTYTITDGSAFALGTAGLSATFNAIGEAQGGLRVGDQYYIHSVAAARTGVPGVLQLNGAAANVDGWVDTTPKLSVEFIKTFTGEITTKRDSAPNLAWEVNSRGTGIDLRWDLNLQVAGRTDWVPIINSAKGKLYAHYRAALPLDSEEEEIALNGSPDIEGIYLPRLGKIDPDNNLAYAADAALKGALGKRVYVMRSASETAAAFATALQVIGRRRHFYAITPATNDRALQQLVEGHVTALSSPAKRRFRRSYSGVNTPGVHAILTSFESSQITATISAGDNGFNRVLIQNEGIDIQSLGLQAGHTIRFNFAQNEWGEDIYDTYTIDTTVSSDEFTLTEDVGQSEPVAKRIEVWAPSTPEFQTKFLQDTAESTSNRRNIIVWTDGGYRLDGNTRVVLDNMYLAAWVAGLRSAVLPQQGLTETEVNFLAGASGIYTRFTEEQLDEISASGIFAVVQNQPSGGVYIAHQLTTRTDSGLLYYEDSIGVNLDSHCFAFDDIIAKYRGKANVTNDLIRYIRTDLETYLEDEKKLPNVTYGGIEISQALIDYDNLVVDRDPNLASSIIFGVRLELPVPFNRATVTVRGSVSLSTGEVNNFDIIPATT